MSGRCIALARCVPSALWFVASLLVLCIWSTPNLEPILLLFLFPSTAYSKMSTEVQPPSPPQEVTTSSRPTKLNGEEKHGKRPPIAFDTQASRRRHGRSSSLGDVLSRFLPSRRPEKGHTLRLGIETRDSQTEMNLAQNFCESSADHVHSVLENPFLKSKTWSHSSGTNHEVGEQQKSGAMKRLFGSIKSMSKKSKDEDFRESKNYQSKHIDFQMEHPNQFLQPLGVERVAPTKTAESSDGKEITKTQQMFENKKVRREQRKSLQKSGDFLGVQGANPRTGYWDISDATSSSEPSQMSGETQKLLAKHAQEVAERRRRYEEAHLKQQIELRRVQALRDEKKKKLEQKRREMRMKQRGRGKWRLSETGWSSVAEPELSPIEQSLAGSPVAGKYLQVKGRQG